MFLLKLERIFKLDITRNKIHKIFSSQIYYFVWSKKLKTFFFQAYTSKIVLLLFLLKIKIKSLFTVKKH